MPSLGAMRVVRVDPAELRKAAYLLDDAAGFTEEARGQAAAAASDVNPVSDQYPFGSSDSARHLRDNWNKATSARAAEAASLAADLRRLADMLRSAASDYDGMEQNNTDEFSQEDRS